MHIGSEQRAASTTYIVKQVQLEQRAAMASSSEDVNAATTTLKCDGPFEVLQLPLGVYNPIEIKR